MMKHAMKKTNLYTLAHILISMLNVWSGAPAGGWLHSG